MGGAGGGMGGAEAVEQFQQVGAVEVAVALGGVLRALDGEVDRVVGRLEPREGARVQLVGEVVAQRVIRQGGGAPGLGGGVCHV